MLNVLLAILVIGAIVVGVKKGIDQARGNFDGNLLVRKYKTTGSMQREMRLLESKGWHADQQTAAAGFMTGTRSYTVTYRR